MASRAEEFMRRPTTIEIRIRTKECERREEQEKLTPQGIDYQRDRIDSSRKNMLEEITAELSAIDEEIDELWRDYRQAKMDVIRTAYQIGRQEESAVLVMYYIGKAKVHTIAQVLHYSEQNIYKLRREGLEHLDEILQKRK